jgi:hypothetical protein
MPQKEEYSASSSAAECTDMLMYMCGYQLLDGLSCFIIVLEQLLSCQEQFALCAHNLPCVHVTQLAAFRNPRDEELYQHF